MFARLVPIACAVLVTTGCEKTNHENLDKWMHTEQGPGKLKKALADESLDPDLSAHAATNMIKTGHDIDVRAELDQMPGPRRTAVVGKLAPRLWEMARIEGDMTLPGPNQIIGKDGLLAIRKYADDATRQQIDTYLIDWYGVASYEGRAGVGAVNGPAVMRMLGEPAAKKLISVANGVIAAPGQEKEKNRVGDELLTGLGATCSPDAVKYVLDVAKMTSRGDATLPKRALDALYRAYVDPGGLFDICAPAPLVPHLDDLVSIAKDEKMPPEAANDAVALIRVVGAPKCIAPLVSMIAMPYPDPRFKYVAASGALRCGGAAAIKDVVRALPDGPYDREDLDGAVAGEIAKLTPRAQVLAALRELLEDKRPLTAWTAAEALADMKSVEDAPKLAALKSNARLVGYWGDQSGVDPKQRKDEPTLAQRAKELADRLGKPGK
ncbi:MAG TPA: HEAT repeat domain-containing protein [Kofleriaceae bacterium]|nr:HEAT repeat domain-containing protein [Kofleriaceae bacterium]